MATVLHQLAAGLYLVTGLVAFLGLALSWDRATRLAVPLLVLALGAHTVAFGAMHALDPPPPLTELAAAVSWMAWVGVVFFLALLRRRRLQGLLPLVAPMAFVAVFYTGLRLPGGIEPAADSGSWPHLHVILASAGLAMLGVAGVAGLLFLISERRLKQKRRSAWSVRMPSLEGLDRVNVVSLALGFPLLTLGVVTGMLWSRSTTGAFWPGGLHEIGSVIGWAIYLVLVAARFGAGWRGREAAASSAAGFVFLLVAVVGVGMVQ